MTTAADDSAVEDAFEALLAGRPVPEGAAGLAAFTQAVRTSATPPGRPNAALAELLATGLLTDQSSPSARTAGTAGSPPVRPSRVRIRRRAAMIFPVLIAKFLSAGAVAQAATGASVVVVAFTGIGAVGALPAPVQDTFATVVETVTPLEAPTSGDDTADTVTDETVVDDVVTEPTDEATESTEDEAETAEFDLDAWIEAGPEGYDSFGAWVTESAHNPDLKSALRARGQNFGSMVSKWAHDKGLDEDDLAAEGVDLDELIDGSTEPDSVVDADVTEVEQTEVAATTEDRGSRVSGNGKSSNGNSKSVSGSGNGNGSGKSSNGNSGGNGRN